MFVRTRLHAHVTCAGIPGALRLEGVADRLRRRAPSREGRGSAGLSWFAGTRWFPASMLVNRIKIDLDRRLGDIDRNIFGSFVEHVGRCVYGGIYEPDSPLADANGLRVDVLEAVRRLRIANIRYPGGNFASGYRWRDGIGPMAERPARADLAWQQLEPNTFGTDEFIAFCRTAGTEPYLVVNAGDGDMREARDWLEYCNGTNDTALSRLRRDNGHPEPHAVRLWGIGNEVDGSWQIGAKTAAEYARVYHEFAKVMRWTDPTIKLVASATSDWELDIVERAQALVEEAGDLIDFMSIHWYVGNQAGDIATYMATSERVEERLCGYEGLMAGLALGRNGLRTGRERQPPIPIALDEWNVWYRTFPPNGGTPPNLLEETFDLADALVVAMHLNAIIRHAATVRMANLAQLVNVMGPIATRPDGLVLQTIFHPFEIYSTSTGSVALDAWWDGDTFVAGPYGAVRALDVSASLEPAERKLALFVVNRVDRTVETEIEIHDARPAGSVAVATVTGRDLGATNTFSDPQAVTTTRQTVDVVPGASGRFHFDFPPHSLTGLVVAL